MEKVRRLTRGSAARRSWPRWRAVGVAIVWVAALIPLAGQPLQGALNKDAARWVDKTMKALTLDQKIGQLIVSSIQSSYTSTDSDRFDDLLALVRQYHLGGLHVFGVSEPAPAVLLNPAYGSVTLGQPFEAASLLNRLQAVASVPLMNSGDFEAGVGFRIAGATAFPRAMAFGAAGDERLAFEAGRITAVEARALGVHVNFAPVVDVNNNPRNPVINTRSFGEDPTRVGALASAYVRGLMQGGMIATLKHFPGHGDTDVDTHLGLATITHPIERLEAVEWAPFRAGMVAGAGGVMIGHIQMPSVDPGPDAPASLSRVAITDVLRGRLGFRGLVYTDSLSMNPIPDRWSPGDAAVLAIKAGSDVVLHSPDDRAAFDGLKAAVGRGEITVTRLDESVRRLLEAKARFGLHRSRLVSLDALPASVGTRAHQAVAREVSQRSVTLIKDERSDVPLRVPREAHILFLSAIDYSSGWGIAAPSRTFLPELKERWPNVTAVEVSDRTTPSEIELLRATAPRYDAIVVAAYVRVASGSGRMDLADSVVGLLRGLGASASATRRPLVAVFLGSPYAATSVPELPAMLLTYDLYDNAELSAVRALAGEAAIGGRLPIALPGLFPIGHGLDRVAIEQP